ncbi:aldolase/citrate lyase family protein [Brevibacillus centrosporus]|jgi:4-hydroxy-2-oxoheptanedioate aldolase|uniref:HpcH/HpaI aldolase family protein n=1 Tax=Brevibacillus centrosporus TaxID=54910 RepID=UPI001172F49F|nr:aldolase/citrate lyase family protein [Brevibacillus centrosporus]MEC2129192.1 aldolase/citrate lyase family protein [Brevibacillus centrosporus]GED29425.1 2,4-dihydroxyhept-2-ene-1,7-dioic acid aldolase [Brevibacillus centrosporus]
MMKNRVKEKLKNGEKTVGAFVGIYSPEMVEMLGHAGFDFLVIDDEHGAFSPRDLENMIRAAECVDLVPIVRVAYDPSCIQKALDRGAKGIQVPMVNNREDAEKVVQRVKFPPLGQRGANYTTRPARYGKDHGIGFLDAADDQTLVIVHIETPEAVANFEEIVSVPGIDMAFIGPTDLSISMGYKEEGARHPEVQNVIAQLRERAQQQNIPLGNIAANPASVRQELENGTAFVAVVITSVMMSAFLEVVEAGVRKD